MSTRSAAALACAALGIMLAGSAAAQEPPAPVRPFTLTVSGEGEAKAKPDVAYVTVGVVTQGRRAQEASQANAAASEKVMAALRQQGIAERDLQTSNYGVQPLYENQPGREPRITGYQVSNQVRATVRALDRVGGVIDAALEAGANNVQGVAFGLEKRDEAEAAALTDAAREARRKAETLARAAGVRITGVERIQEGFVARPVPMMDMAPMGMARAATPVSPGELTVGAHVTIIYGIAPGGGAAYAPSRTEQRLAARRSALEAEVARLRAVYTSAHPRVQAAREQIAALDRQIAALRRAARGE